jgi:hypothetical protein
VISIEAERGCQVFHVPFGEFAQQLHLRKFKKWSNALTSGQLISIGTP